MKLDCSLILYTKANSKWVKELNIRPKNHKNPRIKQAVNLDIVFGVIFFFLGYETDNEDESKN